MSRTAALSTMFLTVKRLMALSFATQREQFEQRTKPTWPRPFLLRPPFLLFLVCEDEEIYQRLIQTKRIAASPSIPLQSSKLCSGGAWRVQEAARA